MNPAETEWCQLSSDILLVFKPTHEKGFKVKQSQNNLLTILNLQTGLTERSHGCEQTFACYIYWPSGSNLNVLYAAKDMSLWLKILRKKKKNKSPQRQLRMLLTIINYTYFSKSALWGTFVCRFERTLWKVYFQHGNKILFYFFTSWINY